MTKVLVDTDVIIDYLRINRGPMAQLVLIQSNGEIEMHLASISVMELYAGLSSIKFAEKIELLVNLCTVVPFDATVARFAGKLKRDKKFPTVPVTDYLIGSTALWLKAELATRNKKHFAAIPGLKFFNP